MGLVERDGTIELGGRRHPSAAHAQDRPPRRRVRPGGPRRLLDAHGRREPAPGRAGRRAALRPRLRPLPRAADARQAGGRHALGRAAADARDRPRPPERQPPAAHRRADEGAVAAARDRGRARPRARLASSRPCCSSSRTSASCSASRAMPSCSTPAASCTSGRPASCSTTSPRSTACSESDEHLPPAHDHGPRPGRDVLPGRLGAVADLRADGRAQLRARRLPHRHGVRAVVHRVEARRRSPVAAAVPDRGARRPGRRGGLRRPRRSSS